MTATVKVEHDRDGDGGTTVTIDTGNRIVHVEIWTTSSGKNQAMVSDGTDHPVLTPDAACHNEMPVGVAALIQGF